MEMMSTSWRFEGAPVFREIDGSKIPKAIQPSDCQRNRIESGRVIALNKLARFAIISRLLES